MTPASSPSDGDRRAIRRTRSKEDLEAHYTKVFKYTKDQAQNAVRAVWWFIREIKPGDIIVANRGQSTVTGRGVVLGPAEFRADRGEWSNCLPVHWFDTNEAHHSQAKIMVHDHPADGR